MGACCIHFPALASGIRARCNAGNGLAEGADFAHLGFIGGFQESVPFGGGQVFAVTMLVVQSIHAAI
jgi:hypothetical protein